MVRVPELRAVVFWQLEKTGSFRPRKSFYFSPSVLTVHAKMTNIGCGFAVFPGGVPCRGVQAQLVRTPWVS